MCTYKGLAHACICAFGVARCVLCVCGGYEVIPVPRGSTIGQQVPLCDDKPRCECLCVCVHVPVCVSQQAVLYRSTTGLWESTHSH